MLLDAPAVPPTPMAVRVLDLDALFPLNDAEHLIQFARIPCQTPFVPTLQHQCMVFPAGASLVYRALNRRDLANRWCDDEIRLRQKILQYREFRQRRSPVGGIASARGSTSASIVLLRVRPCGCGDARSAPIPSGARSPGAWRFTRAQGRGGEKKKAQLPH